MLHTISYILNKCHLKIFNNRGRVDVKHAQTKQKLTQSNWSYLSITHLIVTNKINKILWFEKGPNKK